MLMPSSDSRYEGETTFSQPERGRYLHRSGEDASVLPGYRICKLLRLLNKASAHTLEIVTEPDIVARCRSPKWRYPP